MAMTNEQLNNRALTREGKGTINRWLREVEKGEKVTLVGEFSKFPYITLKKEETTYILDIHDTETGEVTNSQTHNKSQEEMKELLTFYAL